MQFVELIWAEIRNIKSLYLLLLTQVQRTFFKTENKMKNGILILSLVLALASIACNKLFGPSADFKFTPAAPISGQPVVFKDNSVGNPSSWSWDFGDGSSATGQSVSHT